MTALIDIQDELIVGKNFLACVYMDCQSPAFPCDERRALCAVLDAAREKLTTVGAALDTFIEAERQQGS